MYFLFNVTNNSFILNWTVLLYSYNKLGQADVLGKSLLFSVYFTQQLFQSIYFNQHRCRYGSFKMNIFCVLSIDNEFQDTR